LKIDNLRTKTVGQQKCRRLDGTRIKTSIEDEVRHVSVREKEAGHQLKVCIGTDQLKQIFVPQK
jgi:hypothetical protein